MNLSYALANYIRAHGHPCRVLPDGDLEVTLGIAPATRIVRLACTTQAVMLWLGY